MNKQELMDAAARMIKLTRQELVHDPKVAKEYYEKVEHLMCTVRLLRNFEEQILIDLEVD